MNTVELTLTEVTPNVIRWLIQTNPTNAPAIAVDLENQHLRITHAHALTILRDEHEHELTRTHDAYRRKIEDLERQLARWRRIA